MINPISRFVKYNIPFCSNKTYVIGHKNPDSDSICSAVAVAHLQSQLKPEKNITQFLPAINKEGLEKALNDLDDENSTAGSALMITDISQNATFLLVSDKLRQVATRLKELNNEQFLNKHIYQSETTYKNAILGLQSEKITLRLPHVQSRKEQIQPFILQLIEMENN